MSLGPTTVPTVFDLIALGGLSGTATGVGSSLVFPPGRKSLQVSLPTSATATIKVQNSIDRTTWFDVSSSTVSTQNVAGGSFIAEVDSLIPYWRASITAFTTGGTGTTQTPLVAQMAALIV